MGEIADQLIAGERCADCDCVIGAAVGFPRHCSTCERERRDEGPKPKPPVVVSCKDCGKGFGSGAALGQHRFAKHRPAPKPVPLVKFIPARMRAKDDDVDLIDDGDPGLDVNARKPRQKKVKR